jgi:Protein of unknown function (DUF2957)
MRSGSLRRTIPIATTGRNNATLSHSARLRDDLYRRLGQRRIHQGSLDTAKKQYEMTFVESPVPSSPGQVNETRAGLAITGSYETADLYRVADATGGTQTPFALPTAEQNRCALVLRGGQTADGRYAFDIDPRDPPILFVGNGIVGGAIPGATVQFDGVELAPGINVGVVPRKTFDYYPFIAFSKTITDFSRIAGHYNELGIHFTPEGGSYQTSQDDPTPSALGWQADGFQVSETLRADGSCTIDAAQPFATCPTTGTNWRLRSNADGSLDNVFVSEPLPSTTPNVGPVYPAVGSGLMQASFAQNRAHGIMIVGDVDGEAVPVVIRVGYAYAGTSIMDSTLDDQIGISLLSPASQLDPGSFSGAFIGATSTSACGRVTANSPVGEIYEGACLDEATTKNPGINYTSTVFQSADAAFLDPFALRATTNFTLDYIQQQPGVVRVTAQNDLVSAGGAVFRQGDAGSLIKSGRVFALLINGANAPNPFFTIGAFVQ